MIDAAEYYADEEPDQIRAAYDITADTPDDDLATIAQTIEHGEDAELSGLDEYVRSLRDGARDIERVALQEVSREIRQLAQTQRVLIKRLASWGTSPAIVSVLAALDAKEVCRILRLPPR